MPKIMTVDDAAFMRMSIINTLKKAGYTNVIEADTGADAVRRFKQEKPDLIIMDIVMPVMDGIEALRIIKGIDKDALVLMCSAMGQESMVVESIKSGANDFILKPFKPERLIAAVSKLVDYRRIKSGYYRYSTH